MSKELSFLKGQIDKFIKACDEGHSRQALFFTEYVADSVNYGIDTFTKEDKLFALGMIREAQAKGQVFPHMDFIRLRNAERILKKEMSLDV